MSDNNKIDYNKINRQLFEMKKVYNCDTRNKIVEINLGLAKKVAKKYSKIGNIPYEDIFQEACYGLIKAVNNYDLSYNIEFSSYAIPYINGAVMNYIRNNIYPYHVANWLKDRFITYKKLKSMNLSKEEISKSMNISLEKLEKLIKEYNEIQQNYQMISLEEKLYNNDSDLSIGDLCTGSENVDAVIDDIFRNEIVQEMNKILTKREFQIICMRYGFDNYSMTQEEVARTLGTKRQNISSIEKVAIKKLGLRDSFRKFNLYI